MAPFVLSADDRKQLFTASEKDFSATERSSWVNIVNLINDPFFHLEFELYLLEYFIFPFEDRQNSVSWGPPFALCFSLKNPVLHARWQFRARYGSTNKKFMSRLADFDH